MRAPALYGADGPLLMYARLAVQRRGGHAHPIVWELSGGSDFSEQRRRVASQVESAIEEMTAAWQRCGSRRC
jgi:hypothetical protein